MLSRMIRGYRATSPVCGEGDTTWSLQSQRLPILRPRPRPLRHRPDRRCCRLLQMRAKADLSGAPEQAYFSDGITADVITELSRWRLLAVRSRSASFRYRGDAVDTQQ